ncbi:IS66 family transposase, partial [Marinibactrum halimedae]|uniref:IS66 family transposase n=1 Tax=Marinibactrum halimedae TaxID=1444977 RepID=UPI0024E0E06A
MKTVAALQQEITLLREALAAEKEKNTFLNERIQHLLRQRFAPSSEKNPPNQLGLFNEAEAIEAEETELAPEETTTEVKSHTRTRKPRVSIPDNLPREDIIYDLPEHDKTCPHDGAALKNIGSEDHEQLEIIPAKIKVIRHRRLKYACPCCDQHIVTASKPKQPIEKSIASPSLLAFVATQKYADALPLYRQSEMFKRIGIHLDRTNMANWMIQCGKLVQPLINLLIEH